MQETQFCAEEV